MWTVKFLTSYFLLHYTNYIFMDRYNIFNENLLIYLYDYDDKFNTNSPMNAI